LHGSAVVVVKYTNRRDSRGWSWMRGTGDAIWVKKRTKKSGQHVQSRPGKSGWPESISARTQPTDQTSIARVYSLNVSITSGARYHLRTGQHWVAQDPRTESERERGGETTEPRRDVFGQERRAVVRHVRRRLRRARQAKVAELYIVGVGVGGARAPCGRVSVRRHSHDSGDIERAGVP
jgi:hypothetical protein